MSFIEKKIIITNEQDIQDVFGGKRKIYSFVNPVSYISFSQNKNSLIELDGLFSDGGILCQFIKLFYWKKVSRMSFDMTSVAPLLFNHCEKYGKTIYFIGAKEGEIKKAMTLLQKKYPCLKIINFRDGYFQNEEERDTSLQEIIEVSPDLLVCGMGAPTQEQYLIDLKNRGFTGIGFTCGGFIHQLAKGKEDYYPRYVNTLNLRFIYRFIIEKHTRKRYATAFFVFPILFFRNLFVK